MEPKLPPDRDKEFLLQQQQSVIIDTTASSGTIMTAVSSFPSVPVHNTQLMLHSNVSGSPTTSTTSISGVQQPIEKLSRPMAFDKVR